MAWADRTCIGREPGSPGRHASLRMEAPAFVKARPSGIDIQQCCPRSPARQHGRGIGVPVHHRRSCEVDTQTNGPVAPISEVGYLSQTEFLFSLPTQPGSYTVICLYCFQYM